MLARWMLITLLMLTCRTALAQRFAGSADFGSGILLAECKAPAGCDAFFPFTTSWYFDVTVAPDSLTLHDMRGVYYGTIKRTYPNEVRELDLEFSVVFAPTTVPLFKTIDDTILLSGFHPLPESVNLSGAYRSLEFSGGFTGTMDVPEWFNLENRLFIRQNDSSIEIGGTSTTAAEYNVPRLAMVPTSPNQAEIEIHTVKFAATESWATILPYQGPAGDFNSDSSIDAADYVAWRERAGQTLTHADFDQWRSHFGKTVELQAVAVPEPNALLFSVLSVAPWYKRRRPTGSPPSSPRPLRERAHE